MKNLRDQYKRLSEIFEATVNESKFTGYTGIYLCHILENYGFDDEIRADFKRRIENLDTEHPNVADQIIQQDYLVKTDPWSKTNAPFHRTEVKLCRELLKEIIESLKDNVMIGLYESLLEDLKKESERYGFGFLCNLAKDEKYPDILIKDLKIRLSEIDETNPDLWKKSYAFKQNVTAKQSSEEDQAFWEMEDFEPRIKFLKSIIKSLS